MESVADDAKAVEYLAVQTKALERLAAMLRSGRFPNALMFLGADGLGQDRAALCFAMAANCKEPGSRLGLNRLGGLFGDHSPCGRCPSCRKILSGNHQDFLSIRRDGAFVKIAAVRGLVSSLSMRLGEGRQRFAVIHDAARMNKESANALLKNLEEPPARTTFILIAAQTADLLPTLVSRCQPVRFLPVSSYTSQRWLVEKKGADEKVARLCAVLSEGGLARAEALWETGAWRRFGFLSDRMAEISKNGRIFALLLSEALAKAGRDKVLEDLSMIRVLLRENLVNAADHEARLAMAARLADLEACEREIRGNVAARLALDRFFSAFAAS